MQTHAWKRITESSDSGIQGRTNLACTWPRHLLLEWHNRLKDQCRNINAHTVHDGTKPNKFMRWYVFIRQFYSGSRGMQPQSPNVISQDIATNLMDQKLIHMDSNNAPSPTWPYNWWYQYVYSTNTKIRTHPGNVKTTYIPVVTHSNPYDSMLTHGLGESRGGTMPTTTLPMNPVPSPTTHYILCENNVKWKQCENLWKQCEVKTMWRKTNKEEKFCGEAIEMFFQFRGKNHEMLFFILWAQKNCFFFKIGHLE